jgi:hypothetical protein
LRPSAVASISDLACRRHALRLAAQVPDNIAINPQAVAKVLEHLHKIMQYALDESDRPRGDDCERSNQEPQSCNSIDVPS